MRVYADHAATTRISPGVRQVMQEAQKELYGNPSSMHEKGRDAAEALAQAREKMAEQLGCMSKELVFTSGGSESDNQAIRSAALLGGKNGKKHIVSTAFEHPAVLNTLKTLKSEGFDIQLLPVGTIGTVDPGQVKAAIREDTCLVSCMYVNNEIGSVLPVNGIGKICREKGVLFHTDAVQAVGHLPINLSDQPIDLLSLSAHKFHGPKGVGALFVREGVMMTPLVYGGGQESGRRAGTENLSGILGMARAMEEANNSMEEKTKKIIKLRNNLAWGLSHIPGSILNGDPVHRHPGNVSFCFYGVDGESLLRLLDEKGICASSGSACSSGSEEPNHVLRAIGRSPALALSALRLTLDEENTGEEVSYMVREITKSVMQLRTKN